MLGLSKNAVGFSFDYLSSSMNVANYRLKETFSNMEYWAELQFPKTVNTKDRPLTYSVASTGLGSQFYLFSKVLTMPTKQLHLDIDPLSNSWADIAKFMMHLL